MAEALSRGLEYVQSALDVNVDPEMRFGALDRARCCLVDARRARVPPEHMYPLLHSLLNAASADTNQHARVLIGQVCEDLCMRDLKSFTIPCTPFLNRALGDTHVLVVKRAIRTLTALFRRVMGLAVSLGIGTELESHGFPQETFDCWNDMEKRAVAMMNSKDVGVQKAATKFAETVVLALSYSGGRPTPEHFTLDYALARRLNPPILQEFEAEGHRVISSVAGFIYSSFGIKAPAGIPNILPTVKVSPASLMTAFSVIGNLVKRREKNLALSLPSLLLAVRAITGAGGASTESFKKFPEGLRWSLIKLIKHTLKACMGYSHINSNTEVTNALSDIRKIDEGLKHENYAKLHRQPAVKRDPSRSVTDPAGAAASALKRPRAAAPVAERRALQWVPPAIAWDHVQYYVSRLPPDEVPHFVMTRLILDTPPHPSEVPPTVTPPVGVSEDDIRAQKRPRHEKEEAQVVLRETPRKPVRRYAPQVVALKLDENGTHRLMHLTCKSILGREKESKASGAAELRRLVLARQLAQVALQESISESETGKKLTLEAAKFIAQDMGKRRELALAWLHAILYADAASVEPQMEKGTDGKLSMKLIQSEEAAHGDAPVLAIKATSETATETNAKEESVEMNVEKENAETEVPGNNSSNIEKDENVVDAEGNVTMEDAKDVADASDKNDDDDGNNNAVTDAKEEDKKMDEEMGDTKEAEETNAEGVEGKSIVANGTAVTTERDYEAELDAIIADDSRAVEMEVTEATGEHTKCVVYEQTMTEILQRVLGVHVNLGTFELARGFIVDAPVIPASVMGLLRTASRDIEKNEFALHTLRDIVLERYGTDRKEALEILLSLAIDYDTVIRGPTIRLVAETLYNDLPGDVPVQIEAFTFDGLDKVIETIAVSKDATTDTTSTHPSLSELEQRSWLACALVSQKQSLLGRFAESYTKASGAARELLHGRAKALSGQLGAQSTEMVQLIESDTGAPDFALAILVGVVSKYGRPSTTLVEAACKRFDACGDVRFLDAILPGMGRELLQKYLGDLVKWTAGEMAGGNDEVAETDTTATTTPEVAKAFSKMFRTIMESQPPALGATELLVALHNLDADSTGAQAAIRSCFELKAIFKYPVVAQALQQLVARTPLPGHLMRTVLLTRAYHEDVDEYLSESIVDPLIRKKVWTKSHHKNLYTGFLEYCVALKERSMKILLRLPETQLDAALKKRTELIENFRPVEGNAKALKKIPAKKRKIIVNALKKNKADE